MAAPKRQAIKALKLGDIAKAVGKSQGWSTAQTNNALGAYRAYLSMRSQRGLRRKFLAIDKNADQIWHAPIINTVRYRNDSKKVFGR